MNYLNHFSKEETKCPENTTWYIKRYTCQLTSMLYLESRIISQYTLASHETHKIWFDIWLRVSGGTAGEVSLWRRMTSDILVNFGLGNGLSPVWHKAINQCWLIVTWTIRADFNEISINIAITNILIQENTFEYVVSRMAAMFYQASILVLKYGVVN